MNVTLYTNVYLVFTQFCILFVRKIMDLTKVYNNFTGPHSSASVDTHDPHRYHVGTTYIE